MFCICLFALHTFKQKDFYVFKKIVLQFLLEDARSNEAIPKSQTKSHIPTSLDASADTTVTLPLRRPSPKEIDDKGELVMLTQF